MVSLLLATLVVALISRTLPQLNAVAVGLNFNSLIVLGMLRPLPRLRRLGISGGACEASYQIRGADYSYLLIHCKRQHNTLPS